MSSEHENGSSSKHLYPVDLAEFLHDLLRIWGGSYVPEPQFHSVANKTLAFFVRKMDFPSKRYTVLIEESSLEDITSSEVGSSEIRE